LAWSGAPSILFGEGEYPDLLVVVIPAHARQRGSARCGPGETFGQYPFCDRRNPSVQQLSIPSAVVSLDVPNAHHLTAAAVAEALAVAPSDGLTDAEAARRRDAAGDNELQEARRQPGWLRFTNQFRDLLILILLGAAAVAFVVSGELKTPLVVLAVVLINAVIGFVQENRAERSLEALRNMLVDEARVRRDGRTVVVPASNLVPGDIVLLEAGDRVPADGRLLLANSVEIDEAVLTGESRPSAKDIGVVAAEAAPVGDRSCMAHMNTVVTRGRLEMVVTTTGMRTEIGRIAGLLNATETERTPLQRQLDGLAHSLAKLAALIVAAVFVIGLARGQSLGDVMLTAVALAVAAIPEGLPAVTVVTLAVGVSKMAKRNAIVKRLASVETLGCTTVICSDKTGTLTLNEMTAVELVVQLRSHAVSGRGYAPDGRIEPLPGDDPAAFASALRAMALCNDAIISATDDGWRLVGDPTEGALVALAAKGGVDVADVRAQHPRRAELPFDSANKFMVTAHEMVIDGEREVVRVFVKGAPDVLLSRINAAVGVDAVAVPIAAAARDVHDRIEHMAHRGLRVLAIAQRDFDIAEFAEWKRSRGEVVDLAGNLTLVALVGIVDPPRPEAQQAIAQARGAGIDVKMITGDHATTAASIARQLGLTGGVVTGAELDLIDDAELSDRIDEISVFARVAPEHKIRIVTVLQARGDVVAMTGDGVNDAPALKKADIGVAMGITGTDVTKQAATMVLTDDNFATIVDAVGRGRTIYDNIVKFVRFQLATTLGFASLFLLASLLGIADGKPFTAIAILWVNIVMDGPPAMALGLDPTSRDVMERQPRSPLERIITRPRWYAIGLSAAVMAIGTLAVLAYAPGPAPEADTATVAGTMALNTFVLFQFFNLLNSRSETRSVFHRDTFRNRWLWVSLSGVILLQIAVTHVGFVQGLFDTTDITVTNWAVCALVASSVLWVEEARKLVHRKRLR
jgi:Ca2+-transporting ATPase